VHLGAGQIGQRLCGILHTQVNVNYPICGQISFNRSLWYAFTLKLDNNLMVLLLEIQIATGKGIAERVIRPAKAIPASHVEAGHTQLLIVIDRIWNVLRRFDEWMEESMAGMRTVHVLMEVLIETMELIIFRVYIFVSMLALSVRYRISPWISEALAYTPICAADFKTTERYYWWPNDNWKWSKRQSGASGEWWGSPRSGWLQVCTEYCIQYNQQQIET